MFDSHVSFDDRLVGIMDGSKKWDGHTEWVDDVRLTIWRLTYDSI